MYWIERALINHAKLHLAYTDMSVSEIAYDMHFSSVSAYPRSESRSGRYPRESGRCRWCASHWPASRNWCSNRVSSEPPPSPGKPLQNYIPVRRHESGAVIYFLLNYLLIYHYNIVYYRSIGFLDGVFCLSNQSQTLSLFFP